MVSSEVQKSEPSLSFLVFSNIVLNSIKFYLKVYFCKNKSEAELIYLCGNVLKTLFWFYSLYRNMAKLSQEHFRSLYIHIHNQTHIPVSDIAGLGGGGGGKGNLIFIHSDLLFLLKFIYYVPYC